MVAGFAIGVVAALLGVAGGELLIPTLVLLFGVDIKLAGSLSLSSACRPCSSASPATAVIGASPCSRATALRAAHGGWVGRGKLVGARMLGIDRRASVPCRCSPLSCSSRPQGVAAQIGDSRIAAVRPIIRPTLACLEGRCAPETLRLLARAPSVPAVGMPGPRTRASPLAALGEWCCIALSPR